ncbi:histone H3-like centromeric protein HTR12 isoform X2 [Jatropha curcas]|uniref:histone H3-like centromeric protein HTR12 isoform X2 n=1 Tax=Jatropha curcas TaxID=180498 RepID=UPI0009D66752|nr:histone H3-like centromeric protein HTR12 isoform X2 [Jatropha curcas]
MARVKHKAPPRTRSGRKSTERANAPTPTSTPNSTPRPSTSRARRNSPSTPGTQRGRKPHRFKPGTVALREIRQFQKSWELLIPAASFIRLVRSITGEYSREVSRWTAEALVALQEFICYFFVGSRRFFGSFI